MKFFRLDLLTLLISLFILNSCKNQDSVGLGISTATPLSGTQTDTSTIVINTVLDDSIATSIPSSGAFAKNPLGYFNDPIFGITQSDIATDINLPSQAAYTLPTGTITIDSVRLVLKTADGFYGDSISSKYKVNVYQLQTKFRTDTNYYNTKYWGNYANSALLGTLTFNARTHQSVKIYNIIKGAPDTLINAVPQIRIPINPQFINTNFFNAGSTTLASNAIFQNNLRGLYLTLDKTGTTGAGGILMIKPADSLAIYYKATSGTTVDTSVVYLQVSNFAAKINHIYSATINNELNNKTTSRGTFYLQGLGGLRAKVSFPNLLVNLRNNLLKKDSDIVLNRAELVISTNPGSDIPYRALPQITLYQLDLAGQRTEVQDASAADPRSGGVAVFGGFYSNTNKQYHFILTAYLQDLLLKKTVNYGTYIAPVDTNRSATSVPISVTSQVAARTAAVGSNGTSPYRIRLNIIYTKIRKN